MQYYADNINAMANTKSNKKATPKKNTGLFVLSWVLVAILIVALFFAKKDTISNNLKNTDFFGKITGKSKADTQNVYSEATGSENIKAQIEDAKIATDSATDEPKNTYSHNNNAATKPSINKAKVSDKNTETNIEHTKSPNTSNKKNEKKITSPQMNATLFFVTVTSDGTVSRKTIKRDIPKSASPLTATIKSLLDGPNATDKKNGTMTLIPPGTKLLGASVKNGIATLNFSDELEFNSVGVDGYMASLMQIVFTATEFSTVKSVKILIDGSEREYLGSDGLLPGLYIKTPLARNSF